MKGDEGLYREACEKYARAIEIKPDKHEALSNWGTALLQRWRLSGDNGLLDEAQTVLDRHEVLNPSAPYNRACIAALLGDEEGCRMRLLRAKGAGTLPSGDHLLDDEDLTMVRDRPWFQELLADGQTAGKRKPSPSGKRKGRGSRPSPRDRSRTPP